MSSDILFFKDDYRFLSNFWRAPIYFEGFMYPSTEHAYQAYKQTDVEYRIPFMDFELSAAKAKKLGSQAKLRPDWEFGKALIMYKVVKAKFTQHPDLRKKLLATGDALLVEGNTWGDTYWGQCPIGNGQNMLGKVLMAVRKELANET